MIQHPDRPKEACNLVILSGTDRHSSSQPWLPQQGLQGPNEPGVHQLEHVPNPEEHHLPNQLLQEVHHFIQLEHPEQHHLTDH